MRVGSGKCDVTPPIGIRLGGFASRLGKPSELVHDPLIVNAIFLSSGGEEALLIHADVLGVYKNFAEGVKGAIQRETGIRRDRVFLTATHTHSGPEIIIPMWPNTLPYGPEEKRMIKDWTEFLREKMVEASTEACNNASSARIEAGAFSAPNLTVNRSYEDGPIDDQLSFLLCDRHVDKVLVTNYACHPVCNSDMGISADYPGQLTSELAKLGFENFFITGSAGNVNPSGSGREFIRKISSELTSAATQAIGGSQKITSEALGVEGKTISLPVRNLKPLREFEMKFKEAYGECAGNLEEPNCHIRLLYADEEYEVAKDQKSAVDTVIQVLNIGNAIAFIFIPGELFVEFGLRLKEAAAGLGYRYTFIATHSNDYVGYIPVKRAFELGTYEARIARWSRITEMAGEEMYGEVVDCLKSSRK